MTRLAQRMRAPLVALRGLAASPDLRRIQLAFAGSELGSWIAMIALSVLSFSEGGLTSVGLVLGLRLLPPTIAAPFMGVLADRLPRRRVMITADLTRLVLVLGAAAVVFADGSVVVVYVITSLVAVAATAFRPAQAALLPSLSRTPDELTASNAVSSTIESVMSFVGPALGGVLIAATSVEAAFLVTAGTFLWSALLILGVHEPARTSDADEAARPTSIVAELGVGARTIVGDRRVALLVGLIAAQVVVAGALLVLLDRRLVRRAGRETRSNWVSSSRGWVSAVFSALRSRLRSWEPPGAQLRDRRDPVGCSDRVARPSGKRSRRVRAGRGGRLREHARRRRCVHAAQRAVPDNVLARVFGILESVLYGRRWPAR